MIIVRYYPTEYEISLSGHANTNKKGRDIVCAAVSTLFYTLANALELSSKHIGTSLTVEDEEDLEEKRICCRPIKGHEKAVQQTFWTILVGLRTLASQYPNAIKLVEIY